MGCLGEVCSGKVDFMTFLSYKNMSFRRGWPGEFGPKKFQPSIMPCVWQFGHVTTAGKVSIVAV